eukprot:TRINITY_DN762_c0_g1_i2.p1 TRINITY_DN762_c0_g1~~TRINITY_DN762_c0_g1_i2.p1  ORF type:complete len:299 (+),score=-22.54 TRINITY_DN762_c0_g1_i2:580-1476(+)
MYLTQIIITYQKINIRIYIFIISTSDQQIRKQIRTKTLQFCKLYCKNSHFQYENFLKFQNSNKFARFYRIRENLPRILQNLREFVFNRKFIYLKIVPNQKSGYIFSNIILFQSACNYQTQLVFVIVLDCNNSNDNNNNFLQNMSKNTKQLYQQYQQRQNRVTTQKNLKRMLINASNNFRHFLQNQHFCRILQCKWRIITAQSSQLKQFIKLLQKQQFFNVFQLLSINNFSCKYQSLLNNFFAITELVPRLINYLKSITIQEYLRTKKYVLFEDLVSRKNINLFKIFIIFFCVFKKFSQ